MTLLTASRQCHRWLGLFFTLTVLANFAALALVGTPPVWLTYLPLAPLSVMIPTGLHLFFADKGRPSSP